MFVSHTKRDAHKPYDTNAYTQYTPFIGNKYNSDYESTRKCISGRVTKSIFNARTSFLDASVGPSVGPSRVFFWNSKLTNLKNLSNLTNLQIWQIWQNMTNLTLQFNLSPFLRTHLCSNELVFNRKTDRQTNRKKDKETEAETEDGIKSLYKGQPDIRI